MRMTTTLLSRTLFLQEQAQKVGHLHRHQCFHLRRLYQMQRSPLQDVQQLTHATLCHNSRVQSKVFQGTNDTRNATKSLLRHCFQVRLVSALEASKLRMSLNKQ
ncbi:uncharacterized protein LOC135376730 isoform X2 [Ornithodoros turicata]|uniref:uncharacterized protein LOC135376730 isoform X2 n=1 Tax=Ornithodoros turicata TaxID=34597 RepID=UPI003139AD09